MKIAILSDFHLGYERFREDAFRQAEEALTRAAQMADMIIIPGDIFDNRAPKPDVIAEAINLFRNLSKKEWSAKVVGFDGQGEHYTKIPIIAIPGTHERRAQDVADPVDLLGLAGLIVDISNATAVVELDGERVAVRGIGGVEDTRFRDVVESEKPVGVDGAFNIFMFHESVYEMLPFDDNFIRLDQLPKGFDLYVCGHLHNKLEAEVHRKKLLIPGSTVLTQLRPGEQESKGFYVFDTRTGRHEFVSIKSRPFVLLNIDAGRKNVAESIDDEIKRVVSEHKEKPIIRIFLQGKLAKNSGDETEINDFQRKYKDNAIVEVSKSGLDKESVSSTANEESAKFEKMSVKDYGISVFMEKLRQAGVTTGGISPVELLEILSSDQSKEKSVKEALEKIMQ